MYVPAHFAIPDRAVLLGLIAEHGFATLVSQTPDGLMASHVPVIVDPARGTNGTLLVHLARNNPHAQSLDGADVLTIFKGPHGYVSPSWYAAHLAVPTWNYAAVEAHGRATRMTETTSLREIVARLVDQYESGRPKPWAMRDLSPDYLDGMLKGIAGFEIAITRIEGKHKLSQNRSRDDRAQVIAALAASERPGDRELSEYMARHAPPS